ncbi:hypothetical protein CCP1ISM_360002 [Azospirillaceae bacterium]
MKYTRYSKESNDFRASRSVIMKKSLCKNVPLLQCEISGILRRIRLLSF